MHRMQGLTLAGLLAVALLLAACAVGSPPMPARPLVTRHFGPAVWDPAIGEWIDPSNGNVIFGGSRGR